MKTNPRLVHSSEIIVIYRHSSFLALILFIFLRMYVCVCESSYARIISHIFTFKHKLHRFIAFLKVPPQFLYHGLSMFLHELSLLATQALSALACPPLLNPCITHTTVTFSLTFKNVHAFSAKGSLSLLLLCL